MNTRNRPKTLRLLGGLVLLGLALALVLGVGGALLVYGLAPVSSLRRTVVYTPFHSNDLRTTGLAAEGFTPLSEISPFVLLGVLSSEDRRFAVHGGFDFDEASASVSDALLRDRRLRGASTISQQLVRNVFLSNRRSVWRKLREAIYTLKLERSFSKQEILALYLDVAQLGVGIYGIREASEHYFHKPPKALNLEEAIIVATLLPDPEGRSEWLARGSMENLSLASLERRLFKIHNVIDYLARNRAGDSLESDSLLQLRLAPIIDRELEAASTDRIARAASSSLHRILSHYVGRAILTPPGPPS